MGGGFSWEFNLPGGGSSRATGKVVGQSKKNSNEVLVDVKGNKILSDGIYSVPSTKGESVKAIIDTSGSKNKTTPRMPTDKEIADIEKAVKEINDRFKGILADMPKPDPNFDPDEKRPLLGDQPADSYNLNEAMKSLESSGVDGSIAPTDELVSAVVDLYPELSNVEFDESTYYNTFDPIAAELYESVKNDSRSKVWLDSLKNFYSFIDSPSDENSSRVAKELQDNPNMTPDQAVDKHAKAIISNILAQKRRDMDLPSEESKTLKENLVRKVKEQPAVINYRPASVEAIIDSGRVKSQFETGHGTWFDPSGRAYSEAMTSGVPYSTPDEQRPVYGTIAVDGVDSYSPYTAAYGGVRIILKDSVKDRSTVTAGDSFDRRHIGSPARNPDPDLFPKSNLDDGYQYYVEAQIMGGVSVDDIEEISITNLDAHLSGNNAAIMSLISRLESTNIPVRYLDIDSRGEGFATSPMSKEEFIAKLEQMIVKSVV